MAERMMALSVATLFDGDHNHPAIPEFIKNFSDSLHSGAGRKPQLLSDLGIEVDFPARLLLGIPAKSLTREQRLVAEAYCSLFFSRNLGDTNKLWTTGKGWHPINTGRVSAPIQESMLDVDWMLGLGITRITWEKSILRSEASMQNGKKILATMTTTRYLLSIAAFGFSDPYQFFTATDGR